MTDETDGPDKEGGYKNAPKKHQWPKGQSGNPKGRPKGSLNTRTILESTLKRRTNLKINGKPVARNRLEAYFETVSLRAIDGKGRSETTMAQILRDYLPAPAEEPAKGLSPENRGILNNHIALLKMLEVADEPEAPQETAPSKSPKEKP